jgi:diacylglycerol kinase (ATP)
VEAGAETLCSGEQLLMLATTLDKLILGTRPFWGGATAPLRVTTMPYPVPSIVRWLVPTLYGGEERARPPGSISRAVQSCSVLCNTPFVLDGEFYEPQEGVPLQLEAGISLEYIVA